MHVVQEISLFITDHYETMNNKGYGVYSVYAAAAQCLSKDYDQKKGSDLMLLDMAIQHLRLKAGVDHLETKSQDENV